MMIGFFVETHHASSNRDNGFGVDCWDSAMSGILKQICNIQVNIMIQVSSRGLDIDQSLAEWGDSNALLLA